MSANISIVNVPSIKTDQITIECYLVNADGGLRYDFDNDEERLKRVGLALLISLVNVYSEKFNNPLVLKYPDVEDVFYIGKEEIDAFVKSVGVNAFNLDFDIDILDDSSHPDHPNNRIKAFGWKIPDPKQLDKEAISHLPRVEITMEFASGDFLQGIPEGIWDWSAYDTSIDWL